jgi:hypothetical protein
MAGNLSIAQTSRKEKQEAMMDTKTLVVGQAVFMRSGQVGDWAKVVKVTPTGVIVQSDPAYGDELIRFDNNGTAVDSSDIGVDEYKDIGLFDYDKTGYLAPASCDVDVDIESVKAIASQYDETRLTPRATSHNGGDRRKFRQCFWESFECLKKHSRYSKIPGTSSGPWKLYLNTKEAGFFRIMDKTESVQSLIMEKIVAHQNLKER